MEEDNYDEDIDDVANEVTFKTEVGIEIKQTPKVIPREDTERSDTASRRSILEKSAISARLQGRFPTAVKPERRKNTTKFVAMITSNIAFVSQLNRSTPYVYL